MDSTYQGAPVTTDPGGPPIGRADARSKASSLCPKDVRSDGATSASKGAASRSSRASAPMTDESSRNRHSVGIFSGCPVGVVPQRLTGLGLAAPEFSLSPTHLSDWRAPRVRTGQWRPEHG